MAKFQLMLKDRASQDRTHALGTQAHTYRATDTRLHMRIRTRKQNTLTQHMYAYDCPYTNTRTRTVPSLVLSVPRCVFARQAY